MFCSSPVPASTSGLWFAGSGGSALKPEHVQLADLEQAAVVFESLPAQPEEAFGHVVGCVRSEACLGQAVAFVAAWGI